MPQTRAKPVSKFQRYRLSKQLKGMRLLRLWIPDPRSADFAKEIKREIALLRRAPEQLDASRFIEIATDWPSL
jgi:Protein  of unknown function (DUF3018)